MPHCVPEAGDLYIYVKSSTTARRAESESKSLPHRTRSKTYTIGSPASRPSTYSSSSKTSNISSPTNTPISSPNSQPQPKSTVNYPIGISARALAPHPSPPKTTASRPIESAPSHPDHGITHHYTHCTHTSPPCTRPLNIQPTLIHSSHPARSILLGRCFHCDTAQRRFQETQTLRAYATCINSLPPAAPQDPALQHPTTTAAADLDLDLDPNIKTLIARRDAHLRSIWRGYSARWGPGTLGPSGQGTRAGGRMEVQWERGQMR